MDKDTRNAIERATQRARKLLEKDFAAQLEAEFDVHESGAVAARAGGHLRAREAFQRERIVAAIEHKRAAGMGAAESVADYLRDAAFTTLNRFVALKMLEARELVQECVTKGEQSAGYREFCGMAPGLPLLPDSTGYRLYIESIFDELSTEVKVLFDRRDPSSVLWPKRGSFEQFLEILNAPELARVWSEDETIGWVYQFFNGQDERRKMREESQAPRNSRELAIRNQFFTPRYVVQFLTDNTLGRIWYEMRRGQTALAQKCEYMVRRPNELFRAAPSMLEHAPEWVQRALNGDFAAIPEDLDFDDAVHFAHGIDGYASERRSAPRDDDGGVGACMQQIFERTGHVEGSAADLWTALFLECRADRHSGGLGSELAKPYRDALCQALRKALVEETDASKRAVLVPFRAKKDPRDLRILDPACGSGHFLLYSFDLLATIYEEAWNDGHVSNTPSEATGRTLHDDHATIEELRKAIPGLILAHNLHGVDIDPRCAQIAQLALWMRAQKAYRDYSIGRTERAQIRRSNIVIAEPLVADDRIAKDFVAKLGDAELGRVFMALVEALNLAGDMGLLLRVEQLVARQAKRGQTGNIFAPPEERIRAALDRFVREESGATNTRRRLFADDAAHGVALLEVAEKKFDVVLMNPPFGEGSMRAKKEFEGAYPTAKAETYAAFVVRGIELLTSRGRVGAITSRTGFFLSSFERWREEVVLAHAPPTVFADLGAGVLDSAMVETAAYCLEART